MSITAKECIKRIDEALQQFGRYTYYDKGANEVMDISAVVLELKGMTKDEILSVLTEVSENKNSHPFLSAVMMDLQDWDNPIADELFETDLFQENC